MKIGILTQPLQNNYGGLLQNYALQQVLKNLGHEPVTLDWDTKFKSINKRPLWKIVLRLLCSPLLFVRRRAVSKNANYKLTSEEENIIGRYNKQFVNNNIIHTKKFIKAEEIIEYVKKEGINTFIVGSDQVWRPKYNAGAIYQMFLHFAKDLDVKRVAYAASFGTDKWEFSENLTRQVSPLIKKFNSISVREESAISLCNRHLGVDAIQVLDPTLLLNMDDYNNLIKQYHKYETASSEKVLFHYLLDPTEEKNIFVSKIAKTYNLSAKTVLPKHTPEMRTKEDVKNDIEGCVFPSPIAWLEGFKNASMVICDSFHGCVFSIIYNKPFWVIGNPDRGMARFNSLLSILGLQDRLISISEIDSVDILSPIDWSKVNLILKDWKNKSYSFLSSAGL